jgi:two-component system, chemotaxis family, sensor kinase CheA
MSEFNLAELLPFYLDETDENIATLNDALLRLEQDPADVKSLQEAFRMFHSIKGASVVMGFAPVSKLNHNLESLFDQLRSRKRTLDRPILDLTFRCLDELRDYHRDLRSQGQSAVDLSALLTQVVDYLQATSPSAQAREATPPVPAAVPVFEEAGVFVLTVVFEPNLPLADMKARLVVNRLSTKSRIVSTDPPAERLDEVDPLTRFSIVLVSDSDTDVLRGLADVEGVAQVLLEPPPAAGRARAGTEAEARTLEKAVTEVVNLGDQPPTTPRATVRENLATEEAAAATLPERAGAAAAPKLAAAVLPDGDTAAVKTSTEKPKAKVAETIRVESDRLDHLMNLAGELVITKARFVAIARSLDEMFRGSNAHALTADTHERLETITRGLDGLAEIRAGSAGASVDRWSAHVRRLRDNFRSIQDELELVKNAREQLKALGETIHSLGRVSDGLQKGVLDTRMVPIGPLFERFRRVIRDLSLASGKEVALEIAGEKTELDKRMIDELSDPLIHMVRNSVDHGLEPPADREAAGKPRGGRVALLASHRGNSVVITVSDDGRGIDCERIRKKIVDKGLMARNDARDLSDRDLIAYIWHPGLSTAETITEISGRGVGMDIVKSRIENLSGTVDVRSVPGQGTTFTIRLPLTLAIMASLLVRIYEEIYAIPLDHIDEIVEVRSSQIYRVQGRPTIEIRKKIVALVALSDVFRWGGNAHPSARNGALARNPADPTAQKHIVVVVQNGETTIGLLVDELIGMQEVVLKSLEKNFRSIPGLSGASILGDGRVSLILDLDAVLGLIARPQARRRESAGLEQGSAAEQPRTA